MLLWNNKQRWIPAFAGMTAIGSKGPPKLTSSLRQPDFENNPMR